MGLAQPSLGPGPGNADACTGTTVSSPVVVPVVPVVVVVVPVVPVVLVPVVFVPVVPVVLVPVVACPHAGNANTNKKVRAAKIVLKYGTGFSPARHLSHRFAHNSLPVQTMQCIGQADVAASPAAAKGIRTFYNTSPTTHLGK